jgi:[acyl-carrier-protein] S-malonyltransferase/trans-AT polyketide synthase/acyltransferase/oxidoreductase domain-containing protein
MARDFYTEFVGCRRVFEQASDAIGVDLAALCFEFDPRLDLTEFTQPALLTAELAVLHALKHEFGLNPRYFGGHSLGEYTALCAAGVLSLPEAVRIVRQRGALMQAAVASGRGSMIAVIAPGIGARALLEDVAQMGVDLANRNATDQVVLSGPNDAIARAAAKLGEHFHGSEYRIVPLQVSAPFHSRMMNVIEPRLREVLEDVASTFDVGRAEVVTSNHTGDFHVAEDTALLQALSMQACTTVEWIANMRALARVSSRMYEVGPGRTLRAFFRSTLDISVSSLGTLRDARKELFHDAVL